MSKVRLAIVGAGHLGRFHARVAAGLADARLVAVVDSKQEAREKLAVELGVKPLADHRDLIGLADAVILATPTTSHYRIAHELFLSGIHVLVEKPVCCNASQAEELVQLADKQQLVLQVGHIERFNPAFITVRDRLSDPKYITARRMSGFTFRSTDIGVVLDLMIHDLDLVLNLVKSPVVRVEAVGISVLGGHEDIVDARLQFASGCVANLTASRVSYESVRSLQVFTDQCHANLDLAARRVTVVEPSSEVRARTFDTDSLGEDQKAKYRDNFFEQVLRKSELPVSEANAMEQEQLDFIHAIRTSTEPQVTGADANAAMLLAEKILEQVEAHRWDGNSSNRRGPYAMPHHDTVLEVPDPWSAEDTVIIRRKAG